MSRISEQVLDEIRQRCDIAELIARYVPLKKNGRHFKACCPFHHEKTPSFIVSPDKQIFHCFGCGAGGDVFSFIMRHERLEFPEAVKLLAEIAGVHIEYAAGGAQRSSTAQALYQAHELACEYYQRMLLQAGAGKTARDYLQQRRVRTETARQFRIGYAAGEWQGLWGFLRGQGVPEKILAASGLFVQSQQGRWYDRFRNRILFPIFNVQGRIIGFGGRVISPDVQDQPKYLNSPETELYHKGKHLFGMQAARQIVAQQDRVIIVEGYFDCIIPVQEGVLNVVASLGTAFTVDHVRLLSRYTKNVVIVFDADAAGEAAALRSLDVLLSEGMQVRIASLDQGMDPDTYVLTHGADAFRSRVEQAHSLFEFCLQRLCRKYDRSQPEAQARIAQEMVQQIAKIKDPLLQATYISQLAQTLEMAEPLLREELRRQQAGIVRPAAAVVGGPARNDAPAMQPAEKMLVSLLLEHPFLLEQMRGTLPDEQIANQQVRTVLDCLHRVYERYGADSKPAHVLQQTDDDRLRAFICEVVASDFGIQDAQRSFEDCVRKIKIDDIRGRLNQLQKQLQQVAPAEEQQRILLQQILELKKEQQRL